MEEWNRVVRQDLTATTRQGGDYPDEHRDGEGEEGIGTGRDQAGRGNERTRAGGKGGASSAWVEEAGGYLSVPEVDISGPEEFMEVFVNKSKPAVIKVTTYLCDYFMSLRMQYLGLLS